MSRFKLSNLTPKRAAQIRRGVVSGNILMDSLADDPLERRDPNLPYWIALKLTTYVNEVESFLESEALHRTVIRRAKRFMSKDQFCHLCQFMGCGAELAQP